MYHIILETVLYIKIPLQFAELDLVLVGYSSSVTVGSSLSSTENFPSFDAMGGLFCTGLRGREGEFWGF